MHTYSYIHIFMHTYSYTHIHAYIFIHSYIHTHSHTHAHIKVPRTPGALEKSVHEPWALGMCLEERERARDRESQQERDR